MTTDIQKLLEIAKNSDKKVKWTEKDHAVDDVLTFTKKYNIIPGDDKIHPCFIEALYASTTKKDFSSRVFRRKLKKYFGNKKSHHGKLGIDLNALSIDIKDINKLIGPFLLEKAREEVEKKKKRSIEALRSGANT